MSLNIGLAARSSRTWIDDIIDDVEYPTTILPDDMRLKALHLLQHIKKKNPLPAPKSTNLLCEWPNTIPKSVVDRIPALVVQDGAKREWIHCHDYAANSRSQINNMVAVMSSGWTTKDNVERPGCLNVSMGDSLTTIASSFKGIPGTIDRGPWATCVVPAGGITMPHMDYCTSAQKMFHVDGKKLWLLWPDTPKNRSWCFENCFRNQADIGKSVHSALDNLDGLELHYFDKHVLFSLKPRVIHAVLTIVTSTHFGCRIQTIGTFQKDIQVMWDFIRIMKDRRLYRFSDERALEFLAEMSDDLEDMEDVSKEDIKKMELLGLIRQQINGLLQSIRDA